ncbi:putative RNA-directed DNA polymerase, eukaryota, reverse transcriptase zinc-binding domain protein, partial [Tanacetum coccineum]
TKLSKLDRFLISEGISEDIPYIRVTMIDRIWDGFDNLIKSTWSTLEAPNDGRILRSHEKLRCLKTAIKQLRYLKTAIKQWHSNTRNNDRTLKQLDKLEAFDLIQKAHIKWDIEGDKNSKFFHGMINNKRRSQAITGILHDGVRISDPLLIKEAFLNYYKEKFQAHDSQVVFSPMIHSTSLTFLDRDSLETHISLDKIKAAIWDCGSNKSPGPDGFSFAFIKKYWDLIKTDIFEFVNSFFVSGSMPQGANSSFFMLIPKTSNPISIKYFRPILLIGIHYKIIAKVLANRLSKVIDKVVSKEQSTFVSGHQILDGLFIISEVIQLYKKRKKKMLIFKVDFEKAFDPVSWKYLDYVLLSLGFGSKWRSWIRACLQSFRASILINGSPTFEFSIKCGLRQGDPLSPLLFILAMEGLHGAMSNTVNSGLIRGIKLGSSYITLSHLFYADDVVITSEWNSGDLNNIIQVLYVFHLASSQKINIHKSNIYGIGVSNDEVSSMASRTGCVVGSFPFTYLGLPIRSNMNLTSIWNILEVSSYTTSRYFKAPEVILRYLERLRSRFFLGGSQDAKSLAWVKWSNVLHSFEKGGLNTVIKALHGQEGGLDHQGCNFNGTWSRIVGSFNFLHLKDIIPLNSFCFKVGCGTRIRFWIDIWIGDFPLHIRYNRLYRLEQDKDYFIIDRIVNGQWHWNWSRADIGIRNMAYLRELLFIRRGIDSKLLPSMLSATTWEKNLPRNVNIFLWRMSLDRLPHRLNLSARGIDIPTLLCPSYNGNVESADHIFFECYLVKEVWSLVRGRGFCGDGVVRFVLYDIIKPHVPSSSEQIDHVDDLVLVQHKEALDKVICRPNDISCWVSLLVLSLCILKTFYPRNNIECKSAIKRQHQEESIHNAIRSWSLPGGSMQLRRETLAESSHPLSGVDKEDLDLGERNIKQCKRKICDGHYTMAVRVLSFSSVAPYNDATLEDLKTKHPFKLAPSLPHIPIDHHHLVASLDVVLDKIKSFPRGTSCGRDGLRTQHLMDYFSRATVVVSDELVSSITQVMNLFLDAKCPNMLVMGTVWRRLVTKVSAVMIGHSLDGYLDDLQFGVRVSGGGEAILHAVNRLTEGRRDDVGLSMLLVDFKNAFNLVDREAMLQEVYLRCPAISRWVEFCYSNPTRLYYGEHTLWSCQEVVIPLI